MGNIAFVPVRGGSKSIPKKNIKLFCGRPLVYWVSKAAEECPSIDELIIATDSDEIKEVVLGFGFPKLKVYDRDLQNAQDTSSTESVILEFLEKGKVPDKNNIVLIQATSPYLESNHLAKGIELMKDYDSVISCTLFKRFLWSKDGTPINYDYKNRPRRQDFDGVFLENGAFYINSVENIKKEGNRISGNIGVYEMPEYTALELDEPDDWMIAESIMKNKVLAKRKPPNIKLFVSDVDGVLTDAGMYYSENGDELKKFNTLDGMAFQILREKGIKTAIVTSENTKIVEKRAKKLKVDYLFQGKKFGGKLEAVKEICRLEGIQLNEVAYVGDDINCYDLLNAVGFAACPLNATSKIKSIPNIIKLSTKGGDGVIREVIEEYFVN